MKTPTGCWLPQLYRKFLVYWPDGWCVIWFMCHGDIMLSFRVSMVLMAWRHVVPGHLQPFCCTDWPRFPKHSAVSIKQFFVATAGAVLLSATTVTDLHLNTLRPKQNGSHCTDNIFICIYLIEWNFFVYIFKSHWSLFPMVMMVVRCEYTGISLYNRLAPSRRQAIIWTNDGLVHWRIHQSFNFNSLRPSDAIWRHRSGSALAHVMACCLNAPGHCLNQCWLIISKV